MRGRRHEAQARHRRLLRRRHGDRRHGRALLATAARCSGRASRAGSRWHSSVAVQAPAWRAFRRGEQRGRRNVRASRRARRASGVRFARRRSLRRAAQPEATAAAAGQLDLARRRRRPAGRNEGKRPRRACAACPCPCATGRLRHRDSRSGQCRCGNLPAGPPPHGAEPVPAAADTTGTARSDASSVRSVVALCNKLSVRTNNTIVSNTQTSTAAALTSRIMISSSQLVMHMLEEGSSCFASASLQHLRRQDKNHEGESGL